MLLKSTRSSTWAPPGRAAFEAPEPQKQRQRAKRDPPSARTTNSSKRSKIGKALARLQPPWWLTVTSLRWRHHGTAQERELRTLERNRSLFFSFHFFFSFFIRAPRPSERQERHRHSRSPFKEKFIIYYHFTFIRLYSPRLFLFFKYFLFRDMCPLFFRYQKQYGNISRQR